MEPLEASQIAEKTQAATGFKTMKSWQQYPPKSFAPPPGLSFKELCSNYPNHLDGELLLEMSGAGLKPRDIVEMMSADTRNPGFGTEWSWVAERTKRARWAREGRHGAVSQSVSAKFEESSRPTSESIFVKVGESSQFVSLAAATVAVADLVHQTPPQVPNSRSTSISNVFSATMASQPRRQDCGNAYDDPHASPSSNFKRASSSLTNTTHSAGPENQCDRKALARHNC